MLGMVLGSIVCGYYADKKGRNFSFKKTIVLFGLSLVLLVFSVNMYMAGVALFFFGFAVGGEIALAGTIFQEFCPPSKQHLLTLLATTWCIAALVTALLAAAFMIADLPIPLWRSISLYGIFIAIIFCLFRVKLPETPRFLISNNRELEAQRVLQAIARFNRQDVQVSLGSHPLDSADGQHLTPLMNNNTDENLFATIWTPEYRKKTILFSFAYFCAGCTYTFTNFFMPKLLKEAGVSGSTVYFTIAIQQFVGLPGILLSGYFVETRCGRKYTIAFSMMTCGVVKLSFIFAKNYTELLIFTSLFTLTNYMGFSVLFIIVAESYKTNVRSTGMGWVNSLAKLGGVISPLIGGIILDTPNGFYISVSLASGMALLLGIEAFFMTETRGKSLE